MWGCWQDAQATRVLTDAGIYTPEHALRFPAIRERLIFADRAMLLDPATTEREGVDVTCFEHVYTVDCIGARVGAVRCNLGLLNIQLSRKLLLLLRLLYEGMATVVTPASSETNISFASACARVQYVLCSVPGQMSAGLRDFNAWDVRVLGRTAARGLLRIELQGHDA